MDLYDEFGNYTGPSLDDEEDFDEDEEHSNYAPDDYEDNNGALVEGNMDIDDQNVSENRIVLHEDKKYYPEADEVYPGIKTVTLDEDAQDLNEPIIKPIKQKNFSVLQKDRPSLTYSGEFMTSLMNTPPLIRNIAVVGQFHHGKTLFVDTLVMATHTEEWDPSKEIRYSDTRKDEQEREL
eukprot:gene36076-48557_t